ncbi:MAG TPA: DUF2207 domain-containing protein [Gemmatimonadales bacterium]|nr:DUF2207 domain-containing protein [Gemmatimonadales bacterium]
MSRRDGRTAGRRIAGIAVAMLLALAAPSAAQRTLEIPRFHSRVDVERDGSILVTETITAAFTGSWNGIYRKVPVKYRTPQGLNWSIRLDLVAVLDDAGRPLEHWVTREGHYIKYKIRVPGAENATRTVVLRYRAKNALRYFEEHDELYWNLTGDEWDVPLGMVTGTVTLPKGATGIRATAFNGPYGATLQEAAVDVAGREVAVRMPRPLQYREGVTAVVGWDTGLVARPTTLQKAAGFFASNWPLGIPFLVFTGMFSLWWRKGRDPRRLPVVVQYEPPEKLTPAEAGTLTDEAVDLRDITATLVDLAVRGFVRIEEKEETALFGLIKSEEFLFHRLKPESEWNALLPHERKVLVGIFESGADVVALSDLKDEFYTHLSGIQKAIMDRLLEQKHFRRRPDTTKVGWVVGGIALGFLIGVAGGAASSFFSLTPVPFVIAGMASAFIIAVFGRLMPARTVAGARTLERVLGFGEFLERVDKHRFAAIERTPELFERYLPYAMAFGVEQKWAKGFADLLTRPPTWYTGTHMGTFNATSFSRSLSTMSDRTASTMSSSPRSSSGSGFSGGSSGGGGGGGGGGGW